MLFPTFFVPTFWPRNREFFLHQNDSDRSEWRLLTAPTGLGPTFVFLIPRRCCNHLPSRKVYWERVLCLHLGGIVYITLLWKHLQALTFKTLDFKWVGTPLCPLQRLLFQGEKRIWKKLSPACSYWSQCVSLQVPAQSGAGLKFICSGGTSYREWHGQLEPLNKGLKCLCSEQLSHTTQCCICLVLVSAHQHFILWSS